MFHSLRNYAVELIEERERERERERGESYDSRGCRALRPLMAAKAGRAPPTFSGAIYRWVM